MRAPFVQLYIHLTWSTFERAPLITHEIQSQVHAYIAQKCIQLQCYPIAIGGTDDHIHILVSLHPGIAVADLVKQTKGASSYFVNHVLLPGGNFRWQGAYGAFSIRQNEIETVKTYILNQLEHHANKSTDSALEVDETSG